MPWNQLVDRARECGVSEPELMVLGVVRYATPMRVDHMPAWALKEFKDVGTSYDEVDLEVAVENCIEKGGCEFSQRGILAVIHLTTQPSTVTIDGLPE